jgi:hypothetical protein
MLASACAVGGARRATVSASVISARAASRVSAISVWLLAAGTVTTIHARSGCVSARTGTAAARASR